MASWFRARLFALSLLISAVAAAPSTAAVVLLDTPFVSNDGISWSRFGPEFSTVSGSITTDRGYGVTLGGVTALTVLSGSTYNSGFLPSDTVAAAFDATFTPLSGPIRLDFEFGQRQVGARIQANPFGNFTARIRAFGLGGLLLDSFTVAGANSGNGDGSAPFIGVGSALTEIYAVEFDIDGDSTAMAIGDVSLVPEPSTLVLTVMGAVALLRRRRV